MASFLGTKDTDIFSDLLFLYLLREGTFFGLWKRYEHLETKINNHSTSALGSDEMADEMAQRCVCYNHFLSSKRECHSHGLLKKKTKLR